MRRRYRILAFNRVNGRYLSLQVEWRDSNGAWHSKLVRSYGIASDAATAQAEGDLHELRRVAGDESAPIPVGTLSDAVWAGLNHALGNPITAFPFAPLLAARDLAHLGGYVVAQLSGDLGQKVVATQPQMPPIDHARFQAWLNQFHEEDLALILAFQWTYEP